MGEVSPTSRRRRGDPTLDDALQTVGTTVPARWSTPPRTSPSGCARRASRSLRRGSDGPAATGPRPGGDRGRAAAAREAEIVKALNPEQARAVTTTEGPLLILAGAGSGKTRVLAHRIAYLVGVKGVAPWRILAVTFTNRAAAELRERIISLVGEGGRDVQAGTFHALCARVLRQDGEAIGIGRRFVIYDTDDQQALMKQVLREEDLPLTGEFRPSAVLGAISRAKNEMLDPTFLAENAANHRERTIARLATRYQERLRRPTRSTSTTCCSRPSGCSRRRPRCWPSTRTRWRYLHVDEYQDTNRAQYLWVRALAAQAPQPVRRRRRRPVDLLAGAAPTCATSSTSSATGRTPTVVKLEQNYRSTQLDPRRRPRRRLAQHGAQGQEALDRERGRAEDPALRGLQRGRGGGVDRPPGRGPGRRPRHGPDPARRRRATRTRGSAPARSRSCTG